MPLRKWDLRIRDIVASIERIMEYTRNLDFDNFKSDTKTVDAVVRNFEIIGEAAAHMPEEVENLIGKVKREGLDAIPSAKFNTNAAFFQLVLLAYNIWRYFKLLAQQSLEVDQNTDTRAAPGSPMRGLQTHTNRIGRLRLLLIAAKVVFSSNRHKLRYSIHDARTPTLIGFLKFLDRLRSRPWPWRTSKVTCHQPLVA